MSNGVAIHYADNGAGPPCLLLHGFTGSADAVAPLSKPLSERHRVLTPDLIGHGRSSAPAEVGHYTLDAVVDQLVALLEAEALTAVDLIGYSMGGR
ncbi:MAG: alpha/beta fold hydrolase, partial [Acidimicrobiales bacterium]